MPASPGFGGIVRTLQSRNFRIYISGNAVSLVGNWVQRVAVGWLTWQMTESGFWLGVIACANLLPTMFVAPFGGVLADRFDRRRLMMTAQTAALCQATALFAMTAGGVITIHWLALLVLLGGIATGFNSPIRLAMMPSLVPRQDLSTGIAIGSIVFNLARFIGPAIAGLVIVTVGVAGAFAANAVSFLAFLVALSRLRLADTAERTAAAKRPSVASQLVEGFVYAARHPGIGPTLVLLSVAAFTLRPFVELLPGFAAKVFAGGADTLAMLSSAIGVGAVMSGLWIARRGGAGLTRLMLLNTLLLALAVTAFVATDRLWFALISAAAAGMAMVASGVSTQTLMQMSVDGAMRGRVLSLYSIIFIGGPAAGALVMGTLSEALGLRLPLAGGVILALAVWLWIWRRRQNIAEALEA